MILKENSILLIVHRFSLFSYSASALHKYISVLNRVESKRAEINVRRVVLLQLFSYT